jgi:hypothetical protein
MDNASPRLAPTVDPRRDLVRARVIGDANRACGIVCHRADHHPAAAHAAEQLVTLGKRDSDEETSAPEAAVGCVAVAVDLAPALSDAPTRAPPVAGQQSIHRASLRQV